MSSIARNNREIWTSAAPYIIPPVAASAAIVPVFYGFIAKSALQIGNPVPSMTIKEVLKQGTKAAPTIGAIVGTQLVIQNLVEKALSKSQDSFYPILTSSVVVGAASAPALAIFNGQTMGQSALASLKALSAKQTGAVIVRETSFLFSLKISEPVSKVMKKYLGENKAVEYGSAFVSGAVGSLIGHPADTALTLWQKNMPIKTFSQTMKGGGVKALAVGGFSVCYKGIKETLESLSK